MNNVAVIPARGGSKRIPGKNLRNFLGKPVLAYSVEAAIGSMLFDEVMVSTDDPVIAEAANHFGAKVPFLRSQENANDYATIADVLTEVIDQYEKEGREFDAICCILPTAPLVSSQQIIDAYSKLKDDKLDSVCPVVAFSYPVQRALKITENNKLQMIWPENLNVRSQDLDPVYHDAGSFIWVKTASFKNERTLFCKNGGAIILPESAVQDIDTESDWKMAEMKYKLLKGDLF